MKTQNIKSNSATADGRLSRIPDRTPAGTIIAIMEIWASTTPCAITRTSSRGGNSSASCRFSSGPGAGRRASDGNPEHVKKAFDSTTTSDYDLAVRTWRHLALSGEASGVQRQDRRVGYCLGGKLLLPDVLPHRHRLCRRLLRHLHRAPHPRSQELHRPFVLHMAMKDRWVQAEVNDLLEARLSPIAGDDPQISGRRHASRARAGRPTRNSRRTARSRSRWNFSGTSRLGVPSHWRADLHSRPDFYIYRNPPPDGRQ